VLLGRKIECQDIRGSGVAQVPAVQVGHGPIVHDSNPDRPTQAHDLSGFTHLVGQPRLAGTCEASRGIGDVDLEFAHGQR
jgi:hypothetical protein